MVKCCHCVRIVTSAMKPFMGSRGGLASRASQSGSDKRSLLPMYCINAMKHFAGISRNIESLMERQKQARSMQAPRSQDICVCARPAAPAQVGLDDDSVVMVAEEDVAQRRARGAAGAGPSAKPQVRA